MKHFNQNDLVGSGQKIRMKKFSVPSIFINAHIDMEKGGADEANRGTKPDLETEELQLNTLQRQLEEAKQKIESMQKRSHPKSN